MSGGPPARSRLDATVRRAATKVSVATDAQSNQGDQIMKLRKLSLILATTLVAGALATACSSTSSSSPTTTKPAMPTTPKNIVQIAASNPDFSTLVKAVTAGGLVSTLEGPGPFTVFAPTNEAFAKLPTSTLSSLLQPANKSALDSILTYHVVSGAVKAAEIMPGQPIKTVNGANLTVNSTNGKLTITDAAGNTCNIVKTDIIASNGVIHVIDCVLLPSAS
jgi:uncharacterized surface protein with fasciclin (FAS1) repeats